MAHADCTIPGRSIMLMVAVDAAYKLCLIYSLERPDRVIPEQIKTFQYIYYIYKSVVN